MKKIYQAPELKPQHLALNEMLLAADVDGGSFQDGWLDVESDYKDEF